MSCFILRVLAEALSVMFTLICLTLMLSIYICCFLHSCNVRLGHYTDILETKQTLLTVSHPLPLDSNLAPCSLMLLFNKTPSLHNMPLIWNSDTWAYIILQLHNNSSTVWVYLSILAASVYIYCKVGCF